MKKENKKTLYSILEILMIILIIAVFMTTMSDKLVQSPEFLRAWLASHYYPESM